MQSSAKAATRSRKVARGYAARPAAASGGAETGASSAGTASTGTPDPSNSAAETACAYAAGAGCATRTSGTRARAGCSFLSATRNVIAAAPRPSTLVSAQVTIPTSGTMYARHSTANPIRKDRKDWNRLSGEDY